MSAFVGLNLAAQRTGRSPYDLLAQGVEGVMPLWRDSAGGCYFSGADLAAVPVRTVCAVRYCGRPRTVSALCLCSTHYARWRRGTDLCEPVKRTLARRGPTRVVRSPGAEPMRAAPREEHRIVEMICRSGHTVTGASLDHEDRQAERLGTPEEWQAIAGAALDRAWSDLASGDYERRLTARLSKLPAHREPSVQEALL